MKRQHLPLYAIALAILVVGLVFAGVPWQWMFIGLLLLACPLHFVMMLGGHGGHGGHSGHSGHGGTAGADQYIDRQGDDPSTAPPPASASPK